MDELVEKEDLGLENKDVADVKVRVFQTKNDTLKATLLYFGSFLFAISLYALLHEAGHAIALLIKGYPGVRIQANPFFGLTWYGAPIAAEDELFISLAGPVFPIIVTTVLTIVVMFFRNRYLLPLLMTGGVAYMTEALNGFGVFFTYAFDNRSDYKILLELGVHPSVLAIIFTLMIVISFFLLWMTWPLLNISKEDKFFRVVLIHSTYILHSLLILIISTILYSGTNPDFLLIASIGVVAQLIFLVARILLYRKVQPIIDRVLHIELNEHKWSVVGSALGVAVFLIIIELIFFR
ncbi:MAG: hypothetical protein FK733_14415 [Asgard group archaeon]|nr:hypothetical protein [Asgard group archaeon]